MAATDPGARYSEKDQNGCGGVFSGWVLDIFIRETGRRRSDEDVELIKSTLRPPAERQLRAT